MFIVDLNQVLFATFFASVQNHTNVSIEENLIRHMALNSLRSLNCKFRKDYGKMVIASDSRKNWRHKIFPQYKAARRNARSKSEVDWKSMFASLDVIKSELKEYFPYKFIEVKETEADDIIGALVKQNENFENILIVSGDKDFRQLHSKKVKQYDPIRKKFITELRPKEYLHEHILRGDVSDGVPNVLSEDNTFVAHIRQKPLTKRMFKLFEDPSTIESDKYKRNYMRNKTLIDLSETPKDLVNKIIEEYKKPNPVQDKSLLFSYMMKHRLKNLIEYIQEF